MNVDKYIEEVKRKLESMTFAEIEQRLSEAGITKLEVYSKTTFSFSQNPKYELKQTKYKEQETEFTKAVKSKYSGVAA